MERRFFWFCFVSFVFFFLFFYKTAFLLTAVEIFCKTLRGKTYLLIHRILLDAIVGTFLLVLSRSAFFFFPEVSKTYFQGLESMVLCFRCRSIRYFQLCYCQHKLVSFVLLIELLHRLRAQSLSLIYFFRR